MTDWELKTVIFYTISQPPIILYVSASSLEWAYGCGARYFPERGNSQIWEVRFYWSKQHFSVRKSDVILICIFAKTRPTKSLESQTHNLGHSESLKTQKVFLCENLTMKGVIILFATLIISATISKLQKVAVASKKHQKITFL